MKRKILTGLLSLLLVLQVFIPSLAYAIEENPKDDVLITKKFESADSNFITIGKLKGVGFSEDNPTASISVEEEQENNHKTEALGGLEIGDEIVPQALRSTGSPYITGQQPADPDKPKYWANVQGELTTRGIDGTTFDWDKILGKDQKVKLLFTQTNGNVMTGVTYSLFVDKEGTYTWKGSDGKPTYLPLYDVDGKPYTYNVQIERTYSKDIQLINQESNGTPKAAWRPEGDKQVATIQFLDIKIQQVASTKFVSEWHTDVAEADRPQIEGYFKANDDADNNFNFPKNDTSRTVLRESFLENFEEGDEENGPWAFISSELETTPETVEVRTDTTGLTFEEKEGVKTVKSGEHKFKYEFTYDVIDGGKLTMTEIIPVTFDANGGKFASLDASAEQKIVKEVEYDGTLTDKAKAPKKEGLAFEGWSLTKGGAVANDDDFANIKSAKTFYAIWSDEDIQAEELVVTESLRTDKKKQWYKNDFVPTFDALKGQVKVKDNSGNLIPLPDDVKFSIINDKTGSDYTADSVDLKNFLYDKVKENNVDEVSRTETVKAKLTYTDGTTRDVDIPIKVLKNIYKGTDKGGRLPHIPSNYVKVTLDPTDKAKNPDKIYYYVNPEAQVKINEPNVIGKDSEKPYRWTMPGTSETIAYNFADRNQFSKETTITAEFATGKVNIKYVDENGNDIDPKYHIDGVQYPTEKEGVLNTAVPVPNTADAPQFKDYAISKVEIDPATDAKYVDPATATIKFVYKVKATTDDKSSDTDYIKVTFNANEGNFGTEAEKTKDVYVLKDKATFADAKEKVSDPTKDNATFNEWQTAATGGTKVADNKTLSTADEIFYANYTTKAQGKATIEYIDAKTGKAIADTFKVDGAEYPTEKEGNQGKKVTVDEFTATDAPKFVGYEFNRVEVSPKDGTYALPASSVIKVYYNKLADVIKDDTPTDNTDKPTGYVTVTFKPGDHGTLDGKNENVVYYVNPKTGKKNSDLTEPTIKAKTGFNVADEKWTPKFEAETVITADATYTAQYKDGQDIIPVTDPTNPPKKPDGYVTVKFDLDGKGTTSDTVEFYVNPNKEVEITAPKVTGKDGYTPKTGDDAWNQKFVTKAKYEKDTTFVAQYDFKENIVPQKPGEGKPVVPKNYVKVHFKQGEHGTIDQNQTYIFWVNPEKEVDLTKNAPKVYAKSEYKYNAWDKGLKATFNTPTEITAQYKKKVVPGPNQPIVPGTQDPDTEYVKVDFKADTHGKIKDGETKEYWVLKDETVDLKTPAVEANKNYVFKEWKEPVQTKYSNDTTHNAVYVYTGDNVVPQKPGENKPDVPSNFVEVVFEQGTNGTIANTETVTYWVNPEKQVTVTAPKVTANDEYKHVAWTYSSKETATLESVTDTFTENKTTITAKYLKKVLEEEPQADKDAYVKVTFKAEANGKLAEDKTEKSYWVLKDTPVSLTEPTVTANPGWKFIKYEPAVKASYSQDTEHIAQYKEIIVTKDPKDKDYVKVTFDPAAQGTIKKGSAEVWVLKDETIDKAKITPEIEARTGYAFDKWTPEVQDKYSADTKHTATYTYNGDDVVPQKPGEGKPNVPSNFVKVTFVGGANGIVTNTETSIFWVNPTKEVTLNAPTVMTHFDYKHVAWNYSSKETATLESVTDTFANETTITAKYLKKVVTEDPNDKTNYVKVTFDKGANGTIKGTETTTYWVLKNTPVYIMVPMVTPNSGYAFMGWSPAVKYNYDTDTTHTAQYKKFATPPTPGGPGGYCPGGSGFLVGKTTEKIVKVPDNSYLKEVWYMQGFNGDFRPKDGLTRAEAAQILANALVEDGYRYNPNFKLPYRDIGEEWYTRAIKIVTEARVFEGYDDGNFNPQWKITRNEWIATLKRFQELSDVQGNHMNLNKGHWATAEIEAAYNAGWLKIYTDGVANYEGDKFIPRQEVAAVSNKAFNRVLDKTYIRNNDRNLITYRDVNKDMWAYDDILCASNTFLAKRDMYYAQWVDKDNNMFNIYTKGFDIVQAKFQRNPR